MDSFLLSRIQFGINISVHILFPVISIALAWILVYFRLRANRQPQSAWSDAYFLWLKIFALTFAMGVVTGIVMSFQFGTNWPIFMEKAGNIAGPLLGYEVLTAFFLEAGFLGIMLYGKDRVSPKLQLTASIIVAIGTSLSAFWILALNSWMQTPQGYWIDEQGIFHVQNWLDVIFNPSFPHRFAHKILASILTVSFFLIGVSAWQILQKTQHPASGLTLKTGLSLACIAIVLQFYAGDSHGLNTKTYQPAKLAAIEAVWETEKPVPLTLFGLPNEQTQRTDYAIKIPYLGSLILTHSLNGEIKGLNEFDKHPPVAPVFFAFRIMVGMALLMLLVSWYGRWKLYRTQNNAYALPKWLLRLFTAMSFSGWIATLAGWYVTEIGRQPYLIYGLLPTHDALTPIVSSESIGLTLILYILVYVLILFSYLTVCKHIIEKPYKKQAES